MLIAAAVAAFVGQILAKANMRVYAVTNTIAVCVRLPSCLAELVFTCYKKVEETNNLCSSVLFVTSLL